MAEINPRAGGNLSFGLRRWHGGHERAVPADPFGLYRFEQPISPQEATALLRSAPGILVVDKREPGGYMTPHEAAGEDATYVSRIRADSTVDNGLSF
ncbi:Aspartate-semialdehyde dehydrogenase (plasmid) [Methylobacterium bullatum]|uniref:Aspartate-semialdehyde dehydrogenase n=1 Tax=Methylobacterium bullatum TaxID=570505 RepID=A0A679K9N4_9HYPH|nr:Aspartate-semialdehyde dehydrogenase [Methylobacterium bullatum]